MGIALVFAVKNIAFIFVTIEKFQPFLSLLILQILTGSYSEKA